MTPGGRRSSSFSDGRCTRTTRSPPASCSSGRSAVFAPAVSNSASANPEAIPAPRSTSTSRPAPASFPAVAGTAGPRLSPETLSFRTATFMALSSAPADVDLQLVDQPLLLVEHQLDQVAHGDDADDRALLLDQEVPREVDPHQVRALRLRAAGRDEREVGPHRLGDRVIAGRSARQHAVDQLALGH